MARRTWMAAAGALVLLASGEAAAWVPIDGSYPVWDIPVTYRVNQGSIPSGIGGFAVTRIDEGFAQWASPACTFFQAQNGGDTSSTANYQDGLNVLLWRNSTWPQQLGDVNSVIGVTSPVFNGDQMYDADIQFNNVGFCWNDSGGNGCVDTGSIATHEEGHFLGLGHTNVNGSTMVPYYAGGTSQRTIEADDEDGVCSLYPQGGQAASSSGGQDCQSCANDAAQGQCGSFYNACGASQSCVDFYDCISQCGTDACVQQCAQQYPNGAQIYGDLVDCICSTCATECSMECGGSSSSSSTSSSAATSGSGTGAATSGVGGAAAAGATGAAVGVGGSGDDDGDLKADDGGGDPEADDGCGCGAAGAPHRGAGLALIVGTLFGVAVVRRRRRRV